MHIPNYIRIIPLTNLPLYSAGTIIQKYNFEFFHNYLQYMSRLVEFLVPDDSEERKKDWMAQQRFSGAFFVSHSA